MNTKACLAEARVRRRSLLTIGVATLALVIFRGAPQDVSAAGPAAISGTVTSAEESKMEGVVVTARKDGGNFAVSVVSDKGGKYSIPRTHLEPGAYALSIRASGYDLTDPGPVTVAAGKTAKVNLKLTKARDLASQLSSTEWMNSMNGTPEQKDRIVHQLLACNYCHSYQRIMKSKHDAPEFMAAMDRMVKYYADGTAVSNDNRRGNIARIQEAGREAFLEKSPNWGASPGIPRTEFAEFFAKNTMGKTGTTYPFELKTMPRPKGAATKAIITEWDIPTAKTSTHDSALDKFGNLWITDESRNYLAKFDTKTKTFKEYEFPTWPKVIQGTRDIDVDKEGNVWFPLRNEKGASILAKFDPKTEKPEWVQGVGSQFIAMSPDDKVWATWRRVDPKAMKVDLNCNGQAAAPKGAAGYAGNVYVDSKGNPWMMTQIGPGGVMGCLIAENKPVWFPMEGLAGRRGAMDENDVLWYGEYRTDKVAMFDTKTKQFKRWDLDKYSGPYTSSTPDKKGRVYAPSNMSERIYRVDPKTNTIVAYQWPTEFDTKKINWEPNKTTMWFTNMRTARVSRVEILD